MENPTGRAKMQQTPVNLVNPTAQASLRAHHLYANAHYEAYYAHPQNPSPNPDPLQSYSTNGLNAVIHPPGVEPYGTVSLYSYPETVSHVPSGPDTQRPASTYAYLQTVPSGSTDVHVYYQDPNFIQQYELNPSGAGVTVPVIVTNELVAANATSSLLINQKVASRKSSTWKKGSKKIKVAQSAWCEICKVDCNSKSVLDQHKLGKKHKKNLEKLIAANAGTLAPALAPASALSTAPTLASASVPPTASNNSAVVPQGNLDKVKSSSVQKARKKAAETEDLETKKRKILEGGAAVEAVRMCAVCNVVCNSETVFRYHLAGQKHIAMMKKLAPTTGMAAAT